MGVGGFSMSLRGWLKRQFDIAQGNRGRGGGGGAVPKADRVEAVLRHFVVGEFVSCLIRLELRLALHPAKPGQHFPAFDRTRQADRLFGRPLIDAHGLMGIPGGRDPSAVGGSGDQGGVEIFPVVDGYRRFLIVATVRPQIGRPETDASVFSQIRMCIGVVSREMLTFGVVEAEAGEIRASGENIQTS